MSGMSFSDFFGYASICCWLGAQFPQILENIKQQSCESLALPFLFNWMLGDVSNLIGCLLTHQLPFQTYLATYFCFVDCCLLYQYFYYGSGPRISPVYPRARSRTTSSARRPSVDALHYRTLSTTAGNIAAAAALAAHSDTHPEHRRLKKLSGDPLVDEYPTTQRQYEEPQDEASDAVLSALSESLYSESGRRKRVSWSQERLDHLPGGSSRRHPSPVVSATLHHTSAATAALLARGRPLQREEELQSEDPPEEQVVETERRKSSRASRRSAGMVLLGMGVLFGISGYTDGAQPFVGSGVKTGAVLVPTSNPDPLLATGLPVVENMPPSSVDVELPPLPSDLRFGQQRQPDEDTSYERIVGRTFAWLCTTLYLTSRLPQIWKNYVRKSVEGLSMYLFTFAFLGNFFYVLSLLTSHKALLPPPASTEFLRESLPYLLGSGGTFVFDITIVSQSFIYKGRHPRRSYIRSRGNSLVRSAGLAEETAGLLRGDMLAAARARMINGRRSTCRRVTGWRQPGDGGVDPVGNQSLAEPHPEHLRNLVLNYLCHNCYLKTAEAFAKDSAVRHLDKDGDEIHDGTTSWVGNGLGTLGTIGSQGSSTDLSDEMIRNILLRQRIQFEILSGNVERAIVFLNRHFPRVLAEDNSDSEMEVTDENINPSRLEYIAETVNPVHLSLNLRILAFIEACRTVPLVYIPPTRSTENPVSMDTDVAMVEASPIKRDPKDEEKHQEELLICVQKLYATVNALQKSDERAIYLKELSNVGGLLAYTIPEKSPMGKYLHQERRDRVAEQINSAILHHTNMPSISYLELAVRYTHCLWAMLHELRVKVPTAYRLSGVSPSPSTGPQGASESEKELSHEARPFDLQLFLNTRS
ncbi:CTLH/CRA C-terminal to lish motif domain-containing protein [Boletus coccyginus]|nr:CTLH/CRA C-terminal to lish motif domain-containing protein [Boletus coccyginus]